MKHYLDINIEIIFLEEDLVRTSNPMFDDTKDDKIWDET